jgi:hypothetical protein
MNSPLPRTSKLCVMNPPTKAPAILSKIVTMVPPGLSPGMTSLPSPPLFMPTAVPLSCSVKQWVIHKEYRNRHILPFRP